MTLDDILGELEQLTPEQYGYVGLVAIFGPFLLRLFGFKLLAALARPLALLVFLGALYARQQRTGTARARPAPTTREAGRRYRRPASRCRCRHFHLITSLSRFAFRAKRERLSNSPFLVREGGWGLGKVVCDAILNGAVPYETEAGGVIETTYSPERLSATCSGPRPVGRSFACCTARSNARLLSRPQRIEDRVRHRATMLERGMEPRALHRRRHRRGVGDQVECGHGEAVKTFKSVSSVSSGR